MNEENKDKIQEAGRKASASRKKGFHCSESVFTAINETLNITDPSMVRIVTGFHGGGGTHRTQPGVNMNAILEGLASGEDKRPGEEIPLTQVGHLCGALAAGIACIGLLYGRRLPADDLTCVDELCFELHKRFGDAFGEKDCHPLRERWIPVLPNNSCETVYMKAAEMTVELILEAPQLVPECRELFTDTLMERD